MTGDSGEFVDPLNDPRFPDRPNTPEFWRLVEIGLAHDATSVEHKGTQSVINGMVDEQTLIYYARHRLGTAFGPQMSTFTRDQQILVMAVYLDAFAKGYDFANSPEGAKTPAEEDEK